MEALGGGECHGLNGVGMLDVDKAAYIYAYQMPWWCLGGGGPWYGVVLSYHSVHDVQRLFTLLMNP